MTNAKQADELMRVAISAADALRAVIATDMTVYELAEALRYEVNDDVSIETSLNQARGVFERVAEVRAGTVKPYSFAKQIAEGLS